MRLKVSLNILLQRRRERGTNHLFISSIKIDLGNNNRLVCPRVYLSSNKTKKTVDRIIRIINKNRETIEILGSYDFDSWWEPYDKNSIYIDSSDLRKIKLDYNQRKRVDEILMRNLRKDYIKNPSKEKSQIEYMKRNYYGKCKR